MTTLIFSIYVRLSYKVTIYLTYVLKGIMSKIERDKQKDETRIRKRIIRNKKMISIHYDKFISSKPNNYPDKAAAPLSFLFFIFWLNADLSLLSSLCTLGVFDISKFAFH